MNAAVCVIGGLVLVFVFVLFMALKGRFGGNSGGGGGAAKSAKRATDVMRYVPDGLSVKRNNGLISNFAVAQKPGFTTPEEKPDKYALGPVRDVYYQAQSPDGDPYIFQPCFVWLPPETKGVECYYVWQIEGPEFSAQSPADRFYEHNYARLRDRADSVLRDGVYRLTVQPFVVDHPDQFGPKVDLAVHLQFTPGPVHDLAYNPSTRLLSWHRSDPGADSSQPEHYEIKIVTPTRTLVHETSVNATNFPLPMDGPGKYVIELRAVNFYGKGPSEVVSVDVPKQNW